MGEHDDRMASIVAATMALDRRMALRAATWEPHDWSEWEAGQ